MPFAAGMLRERPMREQITTVVPKALLDGVVEQFRPIRVILFGSRAAAMPARRETTICWWWWTMICPPTTGNGMPSMP